MTIKVHNAPKQGAWVEPGLAFLTLTFAAAPVATDTAGALWVSGPKYFNTLDAAGAARPANVALDEALKQVGLRSTILALDVTGTVATVMVGHNYGLYSDTDGGAVAEVAVAGLTSAVFAKMSGLDAATAADMDISPDGKFRLV